MCESSAELGWSQYRKTVSMYLRTEKNAINISETLAKKKPKYILQVFYSEDLKKTYILKTWKETV